MMPPGRPGRPAPLRRGGALGQRGARRGHRLRQVGQRWAQLAERLRVQHGRYPLVQFVAGQPARREVLLQPGGDPVPVRV